MSHCIRMFYSKINWLNLFSNPCFSQCLFRCDHLFLFPISTEVQWCKSLISVSQHFRNRNKIHVWTVTTAKGSLYTDYSIKSSRDTIHSWWCLYSSAEDTEIQHGHCPQISTSVWWEHRAHVCLAPQPTYFYCCAAWSFKEEAGLGVHPFLILYVTNVFETISKRNRHCFSGTKNS